jgi:type VI secretion system protein ImpC
LEGAWRGLHYLVNNTETDEMLKIGDEHLQERPAKTLKKFKGTAWDQSPIFKKMYEEEYGQFGGEPSAASLATTHFDHSSARRRTPWRNREDLRRCTRPFISGARPRVMQMESWQELANPRDLTKIFGTPSTRLAFAAGIGRLALHRPGDAALSRPSILTVRRPIRSTNSISKRIPRTPTHNKYCWANAAYAMATNITRSFKLYGWCSRIRGIESGGAVEGLAGAHVPDRRRRRRHEVPHGNRHQRSPRSGTREERFHAARA